MKTIYSRLVLALGVVMLLQAPPLNAAAEDGVGYTLEDFFMSSLDYSPRLKIAQERWNIGSTRRRAANGQLMPQISATANITENRQRAALNRLTEYRGERYALQLRQVLFDWTAFKNRSAAYLMENVAEAEYYSEMAKVLTEVSEKYFETLKAEAALSSSESELSAVQAQLRQFERLYELQMIQITDLYEARAREAEIQAEQILLRSDLTLAREALRSVSGLAVGDLYRLADSSPLPTIEGNIEDWVERAADSNFDIRAREYALEAADRRVSQQRGAYMPRVALIVQQQQSNLGYDNTLLNSRTDTGYVGIDVSVPLFAGGTNRASVREAMSERSIASNELLRTNLDVGEQTRMAFLRLQATKQRVQAAERVLESRRVAAEASQRGFELGTVTSVDVLNATRDLYMAERDLHTYRYDYLTLSLYLRQFAGTLSASDLLDISVEMTPPEAD